jgi:hypothetical protein
MLPIICLMDSFDLIPVKFLPKHAALNPHLNLPSDNVLLVCISLKNHIK